VRSRYPPNSSLKLSGGLPGILKVRLPKDIVANSVKCSAAAGDVKVDQNMWNTWQEYQFNYDGKQAQLVIGQ